MSWWWLGATMTSWSLSQGGVVATEKAGPARTRHSPIEINDREKNRRQDPAGEATLNSERGGSRSRIRPIRGRLNKPCGNPRRHVDATDRTRPGDDAPSRERPLRCRATSGIVVQSDRRSAVDGLGLGIHHDVVVLRSPPSLHPSPDPAHSHVGNSLRRPNSNPRYSTGPLIGCGPAVCVACPVLRDPGGRRDNAL